MTPIDHYSMKLLLDGRDANLVASLTKVLREPIKWVPVGRIDDDSDTKLWQAVVSPWRLALADFSIANQPGHKAGERGQTFSASTSGLTLISDGYLTHMVAEELFQRMESDARHFSVQTGAGKTSAANLAQKRHEHQ